MNLPFADELFQKTGTPLSAKKLGVGAGVLLCLVFLVFSPVLSGPALWRDPALVSTGTTFDTGTDNISGTWFAMSSVHTAPAAEFLLGLVKEVFGPTPIAYRILAALFHAASALLIWLLMRRLHLGGAFLAALLFALHPLAVGTDAWIGQHAYMGGLTFYLLASLCFLNYQRSTVKQWHWYAGTLLVFVLALLFTPAAIALPLFFAFCVWWRASDPDRRAPPRKSRSEARTPRSGSRTDTPIPAPAAATPTTPAAPAAAEPAPVATVAPVAPAAAEPAAPVTGATGPAAAMSAAAVAALPGVGFAGHSAGTSSHGHRSHRSSRQRKKLDFSKLSHVLENVAWIASSLVRMPQNPMLRSLVPLIPFVLVAAGFAFLYVFWHHEEQSAVAGFLRVPDLLLPGFALGWYWYRALLVAFIPVNLPILSFALPLAVDPSRRFVPLVALAVTAVVLALVGRRSWARPLLLPVAFSAVVLLPLTFLVPPVSYDNLVDAAGVFYFALPGMAIAVAGLLGYAIRKTRAPVSPVIAGLSLALVAALIFFSWQRAREFRDSGTFWERVLVQDPGGPLFVTEAAFELLRTGKVDEAGAAFGEVVAAWPLYAPAFDGLGQVLFRKGEYYVAVAKLDQAVTADPTDPNLRMRAAIACEKWGMRAKAITHLKEIVNLLPANVFALKQLGLIYLRRGLPNDATRAFEAVVKLAPQDPEGYAYLGMLATMQGTVDEARRQLLIALRLDPGNRFATLNLGYSYYQQEKRAEAKQYFDTVLEKSPGNLSATLFLMFTAIDNKDWPQALRGFEALLQERPDDPRLLKVLAQLRCNYPDLQSPTALSGIELAEKACKLTQYMDPRALQVLALAYAKVSRFTEADARLVQAIGFAEGETNYPLVVELGQQRRQALAHEVPPNTDRVLLSLSDVAELFLL